MERHSLLEVLEPTISGLGYELVSCVKTRANMIKLLIDQPEKGIALSDCEKVSRHLSNLLPVEGIEYSRLEVSSPGPERPLIKPEHFTRFIGCKVQAKLKVALEGKSCLTGTIVAADDKRVELLNGKNVSYKFSYEDFVAVNLRSDRSLGESNE